jgi:hypothetical protein
MIGLFNKDSSYFTVKGISEAIQQQDFARDVQSLSIVEEMYKTTTGSLTLLDPNDLYAHLLRVGLRIEVAWGYKKMGVDPRSFLNDTFTKEIDRRGMQAVIQNPSGGGSQAGLKTYSANFICLDWVGNYANAQYGGMTRAAMVTTVLQKLGVQVMDVRFGGDATAIERGVPELQYETDFRFLVRKAMEWQALFRIGYDSGGVPCALFIDQTLLGSSAVAKRMIGGSGLLELNYMLGDNPNVLDFTWQNAEGENGAGDSVIPEFENGQIVFRRYTVENERVVTWQLDPSKVKAAMDGEPTFADQARLTGEIVAMKQLDQRTLEKYFTRSETSTAPNGLGYSINAKIIGNPIATPPTLINLNRGFPSLLRVGTGEADKRFYLKKANHTVSKDGYFTDLEIVDVFTESPTGYMLGGGGV